MLIFGLLTNGVCFFYQTDSNATSMVVQDYRSIVYHGEPVQKGLWAIELSPPAKHHFNLDAPLGARKGNLNFDVLIKTPSKILFQLEDSSITDGSVVETSAFLCDEQKTYCLKKKVMVTLDSSTSKTISTKFQKDSIQKPKAQETTNQPKELFILNDETQAIAQAIKTKKPILIDFYGIWCPPCNLYNETIFNQKSFEAYAKKFVLLKMDADDEKSFPLKSQFKVGGYPTLVIAMADSSGKFSEIERIVGYFPMKEFYARLDGVYQHRLDSSEQRWKGRMEERVELLFAQKDYEGMIRSLDGLRDPVSRFFRLLAETKLSDSYLKDSKNVETAKQIITELSLLIKKPESKVASNVVMHLIDMLNDEFWLKQADDKKIAESMLNQLVSRVDASTLFVKGSELSLPDLDVMHMDLCKTINDAVCESSYRKQAIINYEKLIKFQLKKGNKEPRSFNLEYAALLSLDGRHEDAMKVYQRFIQKFPKEFTFYFAAAKTYLLSKNLPKAREVAEKAFEFSYGDNRIRAMDRLITVMGAQGLLKDAISRGQEFLQKLKIPEGLQVRTGRHVEQLKKTIEKLNGELK